MLEFAAYIEDTWNLTYEVAEAICTHFENADSIFFVNEYVPIVAAQVELGTLSEVYSFLKKQKGLNPLRDKTRNILKKADLYSDEEEEKIELSITAFEIEDISISHRTNVRTRGQIALAKGLGELADKIDEQETTGSIEELINSYIGKDESLKTDEDVTSGVKDILAERYGFEEDARIITREYAEDEGFVELHFKKKTKKFDNYKDHQINISDILNEDLLKLRDGEVKGDIKVKIGLPLFNISELLREHFIENSDAIGIDIISSAVDDAWDRLLHPMIEESVKEHIYSVAEQEVAQEVRNDLESSISKYITSGKQTSVVVAGYSEEELVLVAIDNNGMLLRATVETIRSYGRPFVSGKIKQLFELYHPKKIAVLANKFGDNALDVVTHTLDALISSAEVIKIPASTKITSLQKSDYFKSISGLDESRSKTLAYGITIFTPYSLAVEVGSSSFTLHEKQSLLSVAEMDNIISELYCASALVRVVELGKKNDTLLLKTGITEEILVKLREDKKAKKIKCKMDLMDLDYIDERIYNNISGYIVFTDSPIVLDKSTVHPVIFGLVDSICNEIGMPVEELVKNLAKVESFNAEDENVAGFIRTKVARQLKVAQRYISLSSRKKRRMRLGELKPGAILEGKVTNITGFGVFVDINAVSDGLVHISELANQYVESADQVVSVGDSVRVKVVEVNRKQKKISLSMKQADNGGRVVKASRTQLNDLASFFSHR